MQFRSCGGAYPGEFIGLQMGFHTFVDPGKSTPNMPVLARIADMLMLLFHL